MHKQSQSIPSLWLIISLFSLGITLDFDSPVLGQTQTVSPSPEKPPAIRHFCRGGQVWSGNGQIIRGPGSGGTLRLAIQIDGNRYHSIEGPSLDIQLTETTPIPIISDGNQWNFQVAGQYLNVTLTRANGQVINFNLALKQ